ncbi:MAG: caspase family protein [Gemmataceae bacterium]|nr:caspase family protein [Gemmataceae bacterium]
MRRVLLCFGIEKYSDERIPDVPFAEADAAGIAEALKPLGFEPASQIVLLSPKATKTAVESAIRRTLAALSSADQCCLFYTGHGFAHGDNNFLACRDTDLDDLEPTSVALEWLFGQVKKSACKQTLLFLDPGESSSDAQGICKRWSHDEFEEFVAGSKNRICFTACGEGESSHRSHALKHGIWVHHLLEALTGAAPAALERKRLLTRASLQNYLAAEVPRTLRASLAGTAAQTPACYGAVGSSVLIADMQPILDQRKAAERFSVDQLMTVSLRLEKTMSVRSLSGYAKHHKIPTARTPYAEIFVANLATNDIEDDLNAAFGKLRDAFGFGRKDMKVKRGDSGGSIITPFFDYDVSISINADDPSEVVWRRQVAHIRDPQQVMADEFDSAFKGIFDTLEFSTGKPVSIEALIDQIEAMKGSDLTVRYDMDLQWCEILVAHLPATIRATPAAFSIVLHRPGSTKTLIKAFFEMQKLFTDSYALKLLSFE